MKRPQRICYLANLQWNAHFHTTLAYFIFFDCIGFSHMVECSDDEGEKDDEEKTRGKHHIH